MQVYTTGYVLAMARQADGKVIIGGAFFAVNGVPRNCIARLNADGTLDADWNPGASDTVFALAIDGTNVYVGGSFTAIGGQPRSNLAKLNSNGAADPTWAP